jgi:hypothetical protein
VHFWAIPTIRTEGQTTLAALAKSGHFTQVPVGRGF